ncbi:hypothetical protein CRUP_029955 [Coryphaenoides rupestris]|nr:hypothetical protein CRUP_029955 [Coryphaenoides rupestris]
MADPSPAPQGKPNRNTPDGGRALLSREVRDKHHNAMAICGLSPIRSPASYNNLSYETLPELSMLDSIVEMSQLSAAMVTGPAAASHSPFPRYSREMKSALTPVFKYKNYTRPEETTWLPDFWLQDEVPPEVDTTMESSHLFTPVASPSVMPRLPMAVDHPVQPELDITQVLTGNGVDVVNNQETPTGSRSGTFISPQDDASLNTNITMEMVDSLGSKGNETSSQNKTLESNPVSIGPSASVSLAYSGFRLKDNIEIVSPPTQSAPSCSKGDQRGCQDNQNGDQDDQSNGPDDQSSSQDDQIGSRSNQNSEDNNRNFQAVPTALSSEPPANSTLVTVVDLPSQSKISTTQLVSGKVAEAVSNATFVSPQGNDKLPTPLANITITMEMECSGSESDKPTLRNKTLESNPISIGLGTSFSLADALTGIRLQDTFETANQSGGQDDQSGGQDDQSGGQDDQSSNQGHQIGSRSSEDHHRTFEAVPTALSSEPCANSTPITAVAFPTQSKISTTQLVSGNTQDDAELLTFKANINVTMEMERSGSKSDENLLQNNILDMTPILRTYNLQHETASPTKPSALTCCQDNQTFRSLDLPVTSTPMPDRKDLAAITQTSEVQKRLYADGPSKPLPQMSPRTARPLLPIVRPISHLLRPPSARLAATASSNDKPTVASAAKPRQSLSQTKRNLQPRSEAVSLAKRKRTDVPGPSTTMEASCVSVEPTRTTRSLRSPTPGLPLPSHTSRIPGLPPPPHPPRTLAQELQKFKAEQRRTKD